jgi:hypothetical protein
MINVRNEEQSNEKGRRKMKTEKSLMRQLNLFLRLHLLARSKAWFTLNKCMSTNKLICSTDIPRERIQVSILNLSAEAKFAYWFCVEFGKGTAINLRMVAHYYTLPAHLA